MRKLESHSIWTLAIAILSSIVVISCSGGGAGDGGGSSTDDVSSDDSQWVDALLFDERKEIIDEVDRMLSEDFDGFPLPAKIMAIVDFAEDQPVVTEAIGNTEENDEYITIRFINGAYHVIRFVDDGMDSPTEPLQTTSTENHFNAQDFSWTIPDVSSPKAVFAEHSCYPGELGVAIELAELARNHGYTSYAGIYPDSDPYGNFFMSVEFFKTLANYQIVWIHSHGDYHRFDNQFRYSIMTNDIMNPATDESIRRTCGWDRPFVFTMNLVKKNSEGEETKVEYYSVTDLFIKKYCGSFADNSIVHLSQCKGTQGEQPIVQVLFDLNVGAVLGWNELTSTGTSIGSSKYLYSRLFGDVPNYLLGVPAIPKPIPPIRPSSLEQSASALAREGYGSYSYQNDEGDIVPVILQVIWPDMQGQDTDIMIVPSISGLEVYIDSITNEETLYILGQFGTEPEKVTIEETEVSISSFSHDEIEIDLASLPEKHCGAVVVEHKGRKSNKHLLSLWEQEISGEGQLEGGSTAPKGKINCNIAFRGEFLRERDAPDYDPSPQNGELGAAIEKCSSCSYTISGTYSDDDYVYNYDGFAEHSGTIQPSVNTEKYFLGTLLTNDGEVRYQMSVGIKGKVLRTDKDSGEQETFDRYFVIPLAVTASIDEDGVIAEGEQTLGSFNVEWKEADPTPKPDENTAR